MVFDLRIQDKHLHESVHEGCWRGWGMVLVWLAGNVEHALVSAVLERGMQEGLTFAAPSPLFELLQQRYAVELQAFPSSLLPMNDDITPDWTLSLAEHEKQVEIRPEGRRMIITTARGPMNADTSNIVAVHVHDMLPPLSGSHDAAMFEAWAMNNTTTPPSSGGPRYWCDRSDVAHGIVELLKGAPEHGVYNLAGRRAWSLEDTYSEFSALMQRTSAGQSGEFNIEHLVATGIPTVKVVELERATDVNQRPTIASIHTFLEASTGDGWRPTTPLRQSLMFTIAMLESDHAP